MMNLVELLHLKGLDVSRKIKIVRHQDKRYDVNELRRKRQLEIYQSYQHKPIFNCDYAISFIGMEGTKAKLCGVYKVVTKTSANRVPLPGDFIYPCCSEVGGDICIAKERDFIEAGERYQLRVILSSYMALFGVGKENIDLKKTYFWQVKFK